MQGDDYGPLARLIHRLALGVPGVAELSGRLDRLLGSKRVDLLPHGPPVFVTGLARGGTTVAMQILYETGAFRSLTYRDMPFVLMPRLWERFSRSLQRAAGAAERAHGDGMLHGFDSAEALEEVFWLRATHAGYRRPDRLLAHRASPELIASYRDYMARVLDAQPAARSGARRYLAKNNNHLLRMSSLLGTDPDARVVLCFRAPLDHAASLLAQHHRFRALHARDRFARDYMGWLGHHEFGLDHRPLSLDGRLGSLSGRDPLTLDYWLAYWLDIHRLLLQQDSSRLLWLSHERLCAEPVATVRSLLSFAQAPGEPARLAARLRPAHHHALPAADAVLLDAAQEVHARLLERGRA